jgi:DNA-binding IclR family transcriptional regulator
VASYTVQSVRRALSLLEQVAVSEEPLTAKTLADAQGLSLPTAYHLLNTLVETGYLAKVRRSYILTTKLGELSAAFERYRQPAPALQAAMRRLAEVTGETAYVSTWSHGDVEIAAVAEGTQAVRVAGIMVGLRGSAHARASGKALLAFGPASRLETYLESELERVTGRTICDEGRLRAALEATREQGFAIDVEEFTVGVCCIAAPVIEKRYATDALTISMPRERFEADRDATIRAVLAAVPTRAGT